ncbi:MAG: SufS family cysteine desulfurase [Gammaproteobacteria bacterium]
MAPVPRKEFIEPLVFGAFDAEQIRKDFPILSRTIHGKPLIYLDNAATSQMPELVIDRLHHYHTMEHSNVHRSVHTLSEVATGAYERSRKTLAQFLNAASEKEIVFTRGATDAINLVMHGYGRALLKEGDEILITALEHHSNIVPGQMLCQENKTVLRVAPINDAGELLIDEYARLLGPKTKLVAITHVSNAIGTVNPVRAMIQMAHKHCAVALVDGSQAVPHTPVDVRDLDCDFYVFSGHKMCGPTGIGVLYARKSLLEAMSPYQGGGDMILQVTFEHTTYNEPPYKFEAGTPPIASAVGLGTATEYLTSVGMERVAAHENDLLDYATEQMNKIKGVRIIGTAKEKAAVLSFMVGDIHPHDVGSMLNHHGIAVRAGHHCAQPVMQRFKVPATVRASFAFYNTRREIDALVEAVKDVQRIFSVN